MNETNSMPSGRFRHYKGNEYAVIGTARHSETLEEHVVYRQEYGDHGLWVRPKRMFFETVKVDGRQVPRFQHLGSSSEQVGENIKNVFDELPQHFPKELVHTLIRAADVRIERIISHGHASPEGFWYDQPQHEWVIVLKGAAKLRFEDGMIEMKPGDFINIPAFKKHRVDWTTPDEPTVWLGRARTRGPSSSHAVACGRGRLNQSLHLARPPSWLRAASRYYHTTGGGRRLRGDVTVAGMGTGIREHSGTVRARRRSAGWPQAGRGTANNRGEVGSLRLAEEVRSMNRKNTSAEACVLDGAPEEELIDLEFVSGESQHNVGTLSFPVRGEPVYAPVSDNTDLIAEVVTKRRPALLLCAGWSVPTERNLDAIVAMTRQVKTVVVLETASPTSV